MRQKGALHFSFMGGDSKVDDDLEGMKHFQVLQPSNKSCESKKQLIYKWNFYWGLKTVLVTKQ